MCPLLVRHQGWPLIPFQLMNEINGAKVMGTILHGVTTSRDRTRGKVRTFRHVHGEDDHQQNNHKINEDSPFLGNAREAPRPTRSNQNFKLLYIRLGEELMNLVKVFRRMKCKHDYYLLRKAYGDERIHGLYLSTWKCKECGKLKFSEWGDRP